MFYPRLVFSFFLIITLSPTLLTNLKEKFRKKKIRNHSMSRVISLDDKDAADGIEMLFDDIKIHFSRARCDTNDK